MDFKEIVKKRYATKKFNEKKVPEKKIKELLELIRYSASSFNLQPWKIKIITDEKIKRKLLPHAWMQPQITSCSHLLVFCADLDVKSLVKRLDLLMKENNVNLIKRKAYITILNQFVKNLKEDKKEIWAKKQIYIALGNALNGAKSLGLDSCPMEGFSSEKFSKILNLPENLVPTVLCPIGYASDKPRPKLRFKLKDIFF